MSRTTRRNKQHLIREACGTLSQALSDSWWVCYRFPDVSAERAYARLVARYTSDAGWSWATPSWFTRLHHRRPSRHNARLDIRKCIRADEWDNHVADNLPKRRPYWW